MDELENPKHEAFAQLVARGRTQCDAYRIAGYSEPGARANASRLIANDNIRARIKTIQMAYFEKSEENSRQILWEINNLIDSAARDGQYHAAIKGFALKLRLLGMA